MYDICLLRALSWASRVKLCREPSRDSSQPTVAYGVVCLVHIVRYETNNELPSVFHYRLFCRRIYPNSTVKQLFKQALLL